MPIGLKLIKYLALFRLIYICLYVRQSFIFVVYEIHLYLKNILIILHKDEYLRLLKNMQAAKKFQDPTYLDNLAYVVDILIGHLKIITMILQ